MLRCIYLFQVDGIIISSAITTFKCAYRMNSMKRKKDPLFDNQFNNIDLKFTVFTNNSNISAHKSAQLTCWRVCVYFDFSYEFADSMSSTFIGTLSLFQWYEYAASHHECVCFFFIYFQNASTIFSVNNVSKPLIRIHSLSYTQIAHGLSLSISNWIV